MFFVLIRIGFFLFLIINKWKVIWHEFSIHNQITLITLPLRPLLFDFLYTLSPLFSDLFGYTFLLGFFLLYINGCYQISIHDGMLFVIVICITICVYYFGFFEVLWQEYFRDTHASYYHDSIPEQTILRTDHQHLSVLGRYGYFREQQSQLIDSSRVYLPTLEGVSPRLHVILHIHVSLIQQLFVVYVECTQNT